MTGEGVVTWLERPEAGPVFQVVTEDEFAGELLHSDMAGMSVIIVTKG